MGMFDFWKKKEDPGTEKTEASFNARFNTDEPAKKTGLFGFLRREPKEQVAKDADYDFSTWLEPDSRTNHTVIDYLKEDIEAKLARDEFHSSFKVDSLLRNDDLVGFKEVLESTPYKKKDHGSWACIYKSQNILHHIIENDYAKDDSKFLNHASVVAAQQGNLELLKLAHNKGADLHGDNEEAFFQAIHRGHINTAEYLLQNGSSINCKHKFIEYEQLLNPIQIAAKSEHANMLDWVVRHGGNIEDTKNMNLEGPCKEYVDKYFKAKEFKQELDIKLPEKAVTKPSFSDMVQSAVQQPQTRSGKRKM